MRENKTGVNHCETYKYFDCNGRQFAEIRVGTAGTDGKAVTAEHIALLHEMSDAETRAGWREEKHPTFSYSTTGNLERCVSEDRNTALADWSTNPETVLLSEDNPAPLLVHLLDRLPGAIEQLQPQQQRLIDMVYYDRLNNCEIARMECVTEGAIRDRLRKICARLKKLLSE